MKEWNVFILMQSFHRKNKKPLKSEGDRYKYPDLTFLKHKNHLFRIS